MTEMSPAFRNVVRISAFVGVVLLVVAFMSNKKTNVPTLKSVNRQSGPVVPGIARTGIGTSHKTDVSNDVAPPARSPLGIDTAELNKQAQIPSEGSPAVGEGNKVQAARGIPSVQATVQTRGSEVPAGAPPGDPGSAARQAAETPGNYTKHRYPGRGEDRVTRVPDLVKYNMDDASEPRFPRKPASANENEILAKEFLIPGMVPGIVHYLWCGNRWFGFKQYLALVSAVKALKPDKIVFHAENAPQGDHVFYHQWWDDLVHDYPFLYVHQIEQAELDVCHGPVEQRIKRLMSWIDYDGGGIFVSENTWLLDFSPQLRLTDLDYAIQPGSMDGYIVLRAGIVRNHNFSMKSMMMDKDVKSKFSSCATVQALVKQGSLQPNTPCILVTGAKIYDFLNPMHIWVLDAPFGRMARKLYYGTEEILKPKPSYDELVPNIGHMIWIGGGRMDFLFYLSLLSKLFVLKVDVVYIHGDTPPVGEYWEKLKQNKRIFDRVKFITRPPPYRIYQGEIEWYYRALMSDLIRVDIMIKYGGIYTDTDAIWTKPLSYEDRGYEAVASFDWVDWSYPYPDSVNFGLSYGKRNAPFWRIFRDSMRQLHNDVHGFTGVMMPYKLLEKYPHLLRIDKHLMAICYQQKCHPTYIADYHNETNNHVTTNSIPNWREDLNALHWTHPNPPEYANETTLMAATGMFADVGRFVLKSAGLI